jgi:chemotaxis family two-component system response regulator Rcp1
MSVEVFLIEDNLGDAVLIHDAVDRLSVPVNLHLALDGQQALLMLSNPGFQPDLIVLDLNIPKIPGTALLERWKGNRTPVVVLSSSMNPGARELCLASGVREVVSKPVELEEFQQTVGRIIEQWGARVVSVRRSEPAYSRNSRSRAR